MEIVQNEGRSRQHRLNPHEEGLNRRSRPHDKLGAIKAAVSAPAAINRTMAAANGAEDMGMDEQAVVDVIADLMSRDFDKSMPSDNDPAVWQDVYGARAMTNPRDYPDEIQSAETGRTLRRGVKMLAIHVDGHSFKYGQPGWWASLDDPDDPDGQRIDEDNLVRAAARREAKASARRSVLTPLVIKAIREACSLSQQDAAKVFGGGAKAFEKYESGEVSPSSSMTRLLWLAAKHPDLFQKGAGMPMMSEADADVIRETVRKSSVNRIYQRIYNAPPAGLPTGSE